MPQATTIIRIGVEEQPDGSWAYQEFTTGDGVLISARVNLREGKEASSASIELADPRLEWANSLPLPNRHARIPVDVWWGDTTTPLKVFAGYISSLRATGLPGRLEIDTVDKAKGLRRVARTRNLTDTSAAALIRRLAEDGGLTADLSQAPRLEEYTFGSILQHAESDLEVIDRVLKATGHTAHIRGVGFWVRDLGTPRPDGNLLEIAYGRDVLNGFTFSVAELTRSTTPNVIDRSGEAVYAADPNLDPEAVEQYARLERTGLAFIAEDVPSFDSQSIERAAAAQARAKRLFEAEVTLPPHPEMDVDDQVVLRGFGARFSGVWNIDQIDHDLTGQRTKLSLYNGGSE